MNKAIPTHSLLTQYHYELNSWGRLLIFQREELVFCKHRLAEVVNGRIDELTVVTAENFHEAFLAQEQVISFLMEELQQHKKLLEKEVYLDSIIYPGVVKGQNNLRREMQKGEDSFAFVKGKFEQFLTSRF